MTAPRIRARKGGEKIVCLTAYTAHVAAIADRYCDLLLVGDSLGMVIHGMENTLGVTLAHMIMHGQAVMRGAKRAMVVVDMPFGSCEESPAQAFANAAHVMKETGCAGVKIEGGAGMAPTIAFLARRGIPVMGHVGLRPQNMNVSGGFRTIRDKTEWAGVLTDAKAVAEAGAFALVIEGTVEGLAQQVTDSIAIPAIGIGASAKCDGQILVFEDMIGLFPRVPTFVKRYGAMEAMIHEAIARYAEEVRTGRFPDNAHVYGEG